MKIAAYCRVSTGTDDQLNSLETQKKFFKEFADKYNHNLVRIYADEGISGTKLKNRKEFLKLMKDAEKGLFDMIVVKDISRFARNAVDFLQSIRKLKSMGIGCSFINANLTSQDGEMILGTLALVAQEESANTSKRIKFSKKRNAQLGKVPNLVYGYDKIPGDYFSLKINEKEAGVVRRIFDMYVNEYIGVSKIASILNGEGIKTKRNCAWSQNAVSRILTNEIYIGKIVNGKEEIKDFLTGERIKNDEENWMITENEELKIIDDSVYKSAQTIISSRKKAYKNDGVRNSTKHIFSSLIKCSECGSTFRRYRREYSNVYVSWVCAGRNSKGVDYCKNNMVIDESDLIGAIREYFKDILESRGIVMNNIIREFTRVYHEKNENLSRIAEINKSLSKLRQNKDKYMDMYIDNLITRDELNLKIKDIVSKISDSEEELENAEYSIALGDELENLINETFIKIEDIINVDSMTNTQLKKIVDKMIVFPDGTIDIYLKLLSDIGLRQDVLFKNDRT